ncbi:MAG: hypothetical protein WBL67_18645 [Nitrososphaeraceae archaeon]
MSLLIHNLLLTMILLGIGDSTIVMALNTSNNEPSNNTDFGGLSAESTNIAEANKTGLINGTNNNNGTDFGGLSARSVNITK